MADEEDDAEAWAHIRTYVEALIKEAHDKGRLPEIIGRVLGKDAVLVALINQDGTIETHGSQNDKSEFFVRNKSMIYQMSYLLKDHMKDMMQKAGKEFKESKEPKPEDQLKEN